MFAIVQNGIIQLLIPAGSQFTWNGIDYPPNWVNLSSPEEKAAIGMVNVVYGSQPNDQYYWVTQEAPVYNAQTNQVEINFTSTPKDLVTIQSTSVNNINNQAYTLLQPTDWMVVRSVESGGVYPVPQAWNTWRQTIRTQASTAANAVTSSTTVDQVAAVFPINWTPSPDTPIPQTQG
jgi:hypothetical protein